MTSERAKGEGPVAEVHRRLDALEQRMTDELARLEERIANARPADDPEMRDRVGQALGVEDRTQPLRERAEKAETALTNARRSTIEELVREAETQACRINGAAPMSSRGIRVSQPAAAELRRTADWLRSQLDTEPAEQPTPAAPSMEEVLTVACRIERERDEARAALAEARKQERERCAMVAEGRGDHWSAVAERKRSKGHNGDRQQARAEQAYAIAGRIRSLPTEPESEGDPESAEEVTP